MLERIFSSKLRTKVLFFFLLIATVPVLALGAISLTLINRSHRYDVSQLELQLLNQKIKGIEKFFADTLGILELRVGFPQKSEIEISQQEFLLAGLLEENAAFEEVRFINLQGRETAKKSRQAREDDLAEVAEIVSFREAAAGRRFVGDVYYTLLGPFLTLAAPVKNRNGEIIEVLAAEVNLSQLTQSIQEARLGRSGWLLLLDGQGGLMVRPPGGSMVLGTDVSGYERIRRLLAGVTLDGLDQRDRYETFFDAIPVVGAGKKITELGWLILAEWPIADADAIVQGVRRTVTQVTLVSVVGVMALAIFFARRLVRPIQILEAGTRAIAQGNFEERIRIDTDDELEALGSAFNRMAQDLRRLEELKAAEIRAEALAESLRKEQELSKIKSDFITNTSHNLRTPLSIMNWGVELLLAAELAPEVKELASNLNEGLGQLNAIVHDLLVASQYGPGFQNTFSDAVDVAKLLQDIAQERAARFKEKALIWELKTEPDLPKVPGGSVALKIVFENLLDNAITYTPPKGRITATLKKAGENLEVAIADAGIGIPEADQSSIFNQFFRAKNSIQMKNVGTGLGLYIVKNIIEGHGGKISFESGEGKGTTFRVLLPPGSV